MYSWKGEVPGGEHLVPFGSASVVSTGNDVTVIGFSKPMRKIREAAKVVESEGISVEVIDLRSIRPLDRKTVFTSVRKTNRCVIVDEAWPFASVGSHVAFEVSHDCFDYLDAPVELVSSADVPMPYNHTLELAAQPSVKSIVAAVKRVTSHH